MIKKTLIITTALLFAKANANPEYGALNILNDGGFGYLSVGVQNVTLAPLTSSLESQGFGNYRKGAVFDSLGHKSGDIEFIELGFEGYGKSGPLFLGFGGGFFLPQASVEGAWEGRESEIYGAVGKTTLGITIIPMGGLSVAGAGGATLGSYFITIRDGVQDEEGITFDEVIFDEAGAESNIPTVKEVTGTFTSLFAEGRINFATSKAQGVLLGIHAGYNFKIGSGDLQFTTKDNKTKKVKAPNPGLDGPYIKLVIGGTFSMATQ